MSGDRTAANTKIFSDRKLIYFLVIMLAMAVLTVNFGFQVNHRTTCIWYCHSKYFRYSWISDKFETGVLYVSRMSARGGCVQCMRKWCISICLCLRALDQRWHLNSDGNEVRDHLRRRQTLSLLRSTHSPFQYYSSTSLPVVYYQYHEHFRSLGSFFLLQAIMCGIFGYCSFLKDKVRVFSCIKSFQLLLLHDPAQSPS